MATRGPKRGKRPAKPKPKPKGKPERARQAAPPSNRGARGAIALRQSALLRLSSAIAAASNEQEICESVVNGLRDEALGYSFLGVLLLDDASGDRVMVASVGWKAARPGFRVAPGHGISERAILDRTLHYTPAVRRESNYEPTLNSGSEVDVPLIIEGIVIGVLVVESTEPNAFGASDFEILTAAAWALEKAWAVAFKLSRAMKSVLWPAGTSARLKIFRLL